MAQLSRRRALSALATGFATVLAGCSDDSAEESETDRPLEGVDIPGIENGRLESVLELADAHHDAVVSQSATRRGTITGSPLGADDGSATAFTEARTDGDVFFHRVTSDGGTDGLVREEYLDDSSHYVAIREDGEWSGERVGRRGGTSRTYLTGNTHLHWLDGAARFVGTELRPGGTHYLFTHWTESMPDASRPPHADSSPDDGEATYARNRFLVDEDGLCREFEQIEHYEGDDDQNGVDAPYNHVVEWSLSDVGSTTVEEPQWVDGID
ncbi:DUF7537 family lipoprotein [Natronobacterium texcoconense]|nr:hypothetical protein [Natronobacterium texcoconense]